MFCPSFSLFFSLCFFSLSLALSLSLSLSLIALFSPSLFSLSFSFPPPLFHPLSLYVTVCVSDLFSPDCIQMCYPSLSTLYTQAEASLPLEYIHSISILFLLTSSHIFPYELRMDSSSPYNDSVISAVVVSLTVLFNP